MADDFSKYPHLDRIETPDDLKAMKPDEMEPLASEIRSLLIERVSENGGHLASNLGAVELTLAIHRVFSTPTDHVIFDVGHQSYIHKLRTGRKDRFSTLRQSGGISGFPKRSESEHDCFGTGHSSTSLSAALGFAVSDKQNGSPAYTVCVFGDGAYTGGMIHEALNNCRKDLHLILILNENEMSISKNIGRFAKTLTRLRSSKGYFRTKSFTARVVRKIPLIGKKLFNGLLRMKMGMKAAMYGSNYFENLGLYYLGPVNGNDEAEVERLLSEAKSTGQSCIIHVKTKKGKGYAPAEENPDRYHGMSPAGCAPRSGLTFSEKMGNDLTEFAKDDPRVCAITAAMAGGTGLEVFRGNYPERFYDVGIAEEHAVTFAAGLAANGQRPVVAIYSTFLQRAYDNILHDVALQNLPVVFCIDRAGLNAGDGATHHGIFDVAFLSEIPNMKIYTPITLSALGNALRAALSDSCPSAIRYPNGTEDPEIVAAFYGNGGEDGKISVRSDFTGDKEAVIVTHGRIVSEARRAEAMLEKQGIPTGILLLEQIKPYDTVAEEVANLLPSGCRKIVFLEEEIRSGGMGMMLSDALRNDPKFRQSQTAIMGCGGFGIQTTPEPILHSAGLDADAIVRAVTGMC